LQIDDANWLGSGLRELSGEEVTEDLSADEPDRARRSTAMVALACACCVASLLLTDLLSFTAPGPPFEWDFSICIWLAPIPAVLILRRFSAATTISALLLLAILIGRIADVAQYHASGFLPKLTLTDIGANILSAAAMFIVLMWAADSLTEMLFNLLNAIFGASKDV
jgi:hypothetical protein